MPEISSYVCQKCDSKPFRSAASLRTHKYVFHGKGAKHCADDDQLRDPLTAEMFRMFEQRKTPVQVVTEMQVHPDTVKDAFKQFSEMSDMPDKLVQQWYDDGYESGHEAGYVEGFNDARKKFELQFWCHVCRKPMGCTPNSDMHKALVKMASDAGWSHAECLQRQGY